MEQNNQTNFENTPAPAPAPAPVPEKSVSSGFAVASLVCGIIGIVPAFIPVINFSAYILGTLAVIFGIVALVKKQPAGLSVTGLVLGIIAAVIAVVMGVAVASSVNSAVEEVSKSFNDLSGDNTEELLKTKVNVSIGELNIKRDEYFSSAELSVTVTNISDERHTFYITLEAIDDSGNRIEEDSIFANELGAGQSTTEKAFTLVSSEKIDALKNAKFKIMEVSMS